MKVALSEYKNDVIKLALPKEIKVIREIYDYRKNPEFTKELSYELFKRSIIRTVQIDRK